MSDSDNSDNSDYYDSDNGYVHEGWAVTETEGEFDWTEENLKKAMAKCDEYEKLMEEDYEAMKPKLPLPASRAQVVEAVNRLALLEKKFWTKWMPRRKGVISEMESAWAYMNDLDMKLGPSASHGNCPTKYVGLYNQITAHLEAAEKRQKQFEKYDGDKFPRRALKLQICDSELGRGAERGAQTVVLRTILSYGGVEITLPAAVKNEDIRSGMILDRYLKIITNDTIYLFPKDKPMHHYYASAYNASEVVLEYPLADTHVLSTLDQSFYGPTSQNYWLTDFDTKKVFSSIGGTHCYPAAV
ncbi:hypothetical protein CJU89_6885 [Yarrowia sp. B02]|nr:hypothetical protein CJU89_6885 [Yarrowia sp. B02]